MSVLFDVVGTFIYIRSEVKRWRLRFPS